MATRVETPTLSQPRTLSERLVRFVTRSPIHIALILIAAIWLVPDGRPADHLRAASHRHALERLVARLLEPSRRLSAYGE